MTRVGGPCWRTLTWLIVLYVVWLNTEHVVTGCTGRRVLNGTYGIISDGQGPYPELTHCEWLIEAGAQDKVINLQFQSMDTECLYDYLYVYDGSSFSSPLLASLSGSPLPDSLVAKSGYMLIHLSSDRNYHRPGFTAEYTITDCPFNCSNTGECKDNKCECIPNYVGDYCERTECPKVNNVECGPNGSCQSNRCICDSSYAGHDCTLGLNTSSGSNLWYGVAPPGTGMAARVAHAGVYLQNHKKLWIFGGYTLQSVLDDFVVYEFAQSTWISVPKTVPWPGARYEHCMDGYGDLIFLFGGLLLDGSHSGELWMFDIQSGVWSIKAASSSVKPPSVAGATLTLVENQWLYLFGGRTANHEFSSALYRIPANKNNDTWQKVVSSGAYEAQLRSVGHSTVYHRESKSLIVFGGFLEHYAHRFPERTRNLHMFHVEDNYWSYINYTSEETPPKDRAFHSAVIMGNYMMVFGGNIHEHTKKKKVPTATLR